MEKIKSPKNKTIDFSIEEGQEYLSRCIAVHSAEKSLTSIINKTILGNTLPFCWLNTVWTMDT